MRKLMLGGGLLLASSLLMGCPNPNTYGTPRTVQKGQISHTVALEGAYWTYDKTTVTTNNGTTTTRKDSESLGFPMLPSYQLRYGVTDNMDFGVGIKNFDSLQADFKFNFLRSDTLDLAIDPGLQYIGVFTGDASAHLFWLHLPLLAGINLSDNFSVTASVGAVGGLIAGTAGTGSRDGAYSGNAFLFRAGLGLNIRTSKDFAIGPEVTVMRAFNDASTLFFTGGLGFTFGKHQHFKDAAVPPGSVPPPGAAPASTPNPPPPPAAVTQ